MAKVRKQDQYHKNQVNNSLNNNVNKTIHSNDCPVKDKDGNCLVPGVYRDSDEIGGG